MVGFEKVTQVSGELKNQMTLFFSSLVRFIIKNGRRKEKLVKISMKIMKRYIEHFEERSSFIDLT